MSERPDPTDPDRLFSYHKPTPEHLERIQDLRAEFRALGHSIKEAVPRGPEQTLAMRALHQAQNHAVFALVADDPVAP